MMFSTYACKRALLMIGAAILLGVLETSPAAHAGAWSAPETIRAHYGRETLFLQSLGYDASNRMLASWTESYSPGARDSGPSYGILKASLAEPGGKFGPPFTTRPRDTVIQPFGKDGIALQRVQNPKCAGTGSSSKRRSRIRLAFGNGNVGRSRTAVIRPNIQRSLLATNARGAVVIGWVECSRHKVRGAHRARLYIAVRRKTGSFAKPILIAKGKLGSLLQFSLHVGPDGDVLVVWSSGEKIFARTLAPGRRVLSDLASFRPGESGQLVHPVKYWTSVGPAGKVAIAVYSEKSGMYGPVNYQATVREDRSKSFGPLRSLERVDSGRLNLSAQWADVVIDARGQATVAWAGSTGSGLVVRAATLDGTGLPVGTSTISSPATGLWPGVELTAGSDGTVVAFWTQPNALGPDDDQLRSSCKPPGGQFGPAETVVTGNLYGSKVAASPTGGQIAAAWAKRVPTPPAPQYTPQAIQVVTRAGC